MYKIQRNKRLPLQDKETAEVFGWETIATQRNDRRKDYRTRWKVEAWFAKMLSVPNKKGSKYYNPEEYARIKKEAEIQLKENEDYN